MGLTRQRRDCDLNPGPSAPESSTLTTLTARLIFILVIISIPLPLHSFIPGLKHFFSANPAHRSLPFLQDRLHGLPGLLPVFTFLVFMFSTFSCWFRAVD